MPVLVWLTYSELRHIAGVSMCLILTVFHWFPSMRNAVLIEDGLATAPVGQPAVVEYEDAGNNTSWWVCTIWPRASSCTIYSWRYQLQFHVLPVEWAHLLTSPHIRTPSASWHVVSDLLVKATNSVLFINKTACVSDGIAVPENWLTSD
jgi:hypothetical protein